MATEGKQTDRIRLLNDQFRRTLGSGDIPGDLVITRGIAALPMNDIGGVMARVLSFNDFTEDNDPYGEHDFGSFDHNGNKTFWKIDYYAPGMEYGSEDPADTAKTVRVLTIILAGEW